MELWANFITREILSCGRFLWAEHASKQPCAVITVMTTFAKQHQAAAAHSSNPSLTILSLPVLMKYTRERLSQPVNRQRSRALAISFDYSSLTSTAGRSSGRPGAHTQESHQRTRSRLAFEIFNYSWRAVIARIIFCKVNFLTPSRNPSQPSLCKTKITIASITLMNFSSIAECARRVLFVTWVMHCFFFSRQSTCSSLASLCD